MVSISIQIQKVVTVLQVPLIFLSLNTTDCSLAPSSFKTMSTANESYHAYNIDNFNSAKIWILILFSRVSWLKFDFFRNSTNLLYQTVHRISAKCLISTWILFRHENQKLSDRKFAWAFMKKSNHNNSISLWRHDHSISCDVTFFGHVIFHVLSHSKGFVR